MTHAEHQEINEVVARVAAWPPAERIKLARKILETVEPAGEKRSARGFSAAEVIALLQMPLPAPDDGECKRIVEEELIRKYGT
jgi:hypothetical protein